MLFIRDRTLCLEDTKELATNAYSKYVGSAEGKLLCGYSPASVMQPGKAAKAILQPIARPTGWLGYDEVIYIPPNDT
jgi:hypothetical protein